MNTLDRSQLTHLVAERQTLQRQIIDATEEMKRKTDQIVELMGDDKKLNVETNIGTFDLTKIQRTSYTSLFKDETKGLIQGHNEHIKNIEKEATEALKREGVEPKTISTYVQIKEIENKD